MAKQRRPAPKPTNDVLPEGEPRPASETPAHGSAYFEAVALYERGLEALQRHAYKQAIDLLESVLRQYPGVDVPPAPAKGPPLPRTGVESG